MHRLIVQNLLRHCTNITQATLSSRQKSTETRVRQSGSTFLLERLLPLNDPDQLNWIMLNLQQVKFIADFMRLAARRKPPTRPPAGTTVPRARTLDHRES